MSAYPDPPLTCASVILCKSRTIQRGDFKFVFNINLNFDKSLFLKHTAVLSETNTSKMLKNIVQMYA